MPNRDRVSVELAQANAIISRVLREEFAEPGMEHDQLHGIYVQLLLFAGRNGLVSAGLARPLKWPKKEEPIDPV